jgi:hypothetical protein
VEIERGAMDVKGNRGKKPEENSIDISLVMLLLFHIDLRA